LCPDWGINTKMGMASVATNCVDETSTRTQKFH
jgi:hypothetical protein